MTPTRIPASAATSRSALPALAPIFHSLVGRSCCFALIQGGELEQHCEAQHVVLPAPPYRSAAAMFLQRYKISALALAALLLCPASPARAQAPAAAPPEEGRSRRLSVD